MPHYSDGSLARHGDLVVSTPSWSTAETLLIVVGITQNSDSCNAMAIPLATRQDDSPWFPLGPQAAWTISIKECSRVDTSRDIAASAKVDTIPLHVGGQKSVHSS